MADWLYNHRQSSLFRQMHPKKTRTVFQGNRTGDQRSKKEQGLHINQLELLVIFTFSKM